MSTIAASRGRVNEIVIFSQIPRRAWPSGDEGGREPLQEPSKVTPAAPSVIRNRWRSASSAKTASRRSPRLMRRYVAPDIGRAAWEPWSGLCKRAAYLAIGYDNLINCPFSFWRISNLLYRGFATVGGSLQYGRAERRRTGCRLEIGDTADWKSALRRNLRFDDYAVVSKTIKRSRGLVSASAWTWDCANSWSGSSSKCPNDRK
jgi:hypothetical protein